MRSILLVAALVIALCIPCVAIAEGEIPNSTQPGINVESPAIPNSAIVKEDTNGRPQKLDSDDRDAEDLNPTERQIIVRDAIISNAPALGN